jgi:hypothetical protein
VSCARTFLGWIILAFCLITALQGSERNEVRLLFVGDILLSRQVRVEIEATRQSPWRKLKDLFHQADWVGGNLEGSVGDSHECMAGPNPCFSIPSSSISFLQQAGFRALSVENNHAGDLGEKGRAATKQELLRKGILPMQKQAPIFLRFGETTIGIISLSVVPDREGRQAEIPSVEISRQMRLARQLSNLVMVSIHWGSELLSWPTTEQRSQAQWLIAQGADIILGHHPHVVQPMEVISGKPVYFSLGNHLFDQKYPETKNGLIAEIKIVGSKVRCGGIFSQSPTGSFAPEIANKEDTNIKEYELNLQDPPTINGFVLRARPSELTDDGKVSIEGMRKGQVVWRSRPVSTVSIQSGRLGGPGAPEVLFSLQMHDSPIDNETGLRPYVYETGPNGLIAKWRGSALAWPLIDAVLLPGDDSVICALHRGDSFMVLDPKTKRRRIAAYRWNGFGFTGIDDPGIMNRCRSQFEGR